MKINIKSLHPDATTPEYAKAGDAGMDLRAVDFQMDKHGNYVYYTGLAFELPEGYVGLLFPRSSVSKTGLSLRNSVGVLDSGYRGEVIFKFAGNSGKPAYEIGDRIGQIIILPYPQVQFNMVNELSDSDRGAGGFGSTGS
jgi:dUTP pyrophosphatase